MSDDIIYRQAAIDAVRSYMADNEITDSDWHTDGIAYEIKRLSSAQRTGRWIRKSNWMWTCSCCGSDNAYAYKADDAYEPTVLQDFFCPNCGARMEAQE